MKNAILTILILGTLIFISSCTSTASKQGSAVTTASGFIFDDEKSSTEKPAGETTILTSESSSVSSNDNSAKLVDNSSANEPVTAENKITNKIAVPEQYVNYMKKHSIDSDQYDIVFFANVDLNLDGNEEIVIASGYMDEDPMQSYISQLYILREDKSVIKQLGDNLAEGGYSVCEVKLIRLQNKPQNFLYCRLTNSASLSGFKIIELSNNIPEVVCQSASATGAGQDDIQDFDNDGQYDGFTQYRWSYDVLYFHVLQTYLFKDGEFSLEKTTVSELPDYPLTVKEVVLQYLSLRVIDGDESEEGARRLAELCRYDKAGEISFSSDIWYDPVYQTIMEFDDAMDLDIAENVDNATMSVFFTGEGQKKYESTFHLIKMNNHWIIDQIK